MIEHMFVLGDDAAPGEGDRLPDDELEGLAVRARAAAATITRAQAELVSLARRVRELEGHAGMTTRQWLRTYCGLMPGEAARCVRLAERLPELPALREEFESGNLSEGVTDALLRVATPTNERSVLDVAHQASGAQLATLVRDYRRVREADAEEPPDERVSFGVDHADMWWLRARLRPERGAQLEAAIRASMDELWSDRDADADEDDPLPTTADALQRVSELALCAQVREDGRLPERYMVHVLVDLEAVLAGDSCSIRGGGPIDRDTLDEILEDSWVTALLSRGRVPLLGAVPQRFASAAQYRALLARDRTCRFPGCGRRHHLKAHHVRHHADGGPTSLDNLVFLCQRHHTQIHLPGWSMTIEPDGTPEVRRPGGQRIPNAPASPDPRANREPPSPVSPTNRHEPCGDPLTEFGRDVILRNWLDPPGE